MNANAAAHETTMAANDTLLDEAREEAAAEYVATMTAISALTIEVRARRGFLTDAEKAILNGWAFEAQDKFAPFENL